MKRFAITIALLACGLLVACGSSKPSADECKAAIENMRQIRGTSKVDTGADPRRAVRSCQGNSSKKTVQCFINAKTTEDLDKCEGSTGEKYFEQEKKAQEEIERKVREREADEAKNKADEQKDDTGN